MKRFFFFLMSFFLVTLNLSARLLENESYLENIQYRKYVLNNLVKEHSAQISEKWNESEIHTENVWIDYSNDYNRKTKVDFKNHRITIEFLQSKDANVRGFPQRITDEIYRILTHTTDGAIADHDKNTNDNFKDFAKVDYLISDIYSIDSLKEARFRSKQIFSKAKISNRKSKLKNHIVLSASFYFPKDGIMKKHTKYENTMKKHAKKNGLPVNLIYAITKTESHFNPMARSNIPAYGLMQIVPTSAGKDITRKIEGRSRILSARELYNGYKNIEYGSVYLNLLFYEYLDSIDDETSRLYCTIAAYNTGVGNVSKAFTGHTNINTAAIKINKMSSDKVYDALIQNLPYKETRSYVKTVLGYLYEYE